MSYYTGYYGKIIVREEFYYIIENGLDISTTADPVFSLYKNIDDEDRFDRGFGNVSWDKWSFDRKNGCWEFRVEYNESHQGCPHVNLVNFFIPYISKEIIDFYYFDEYDSPPYTPHRGWIPFLRKQIENREDTIREICEELGSYRL